MVHSAEVSELVRTGRENFERQTARLREEARALWMGGDGSSTLVVYFVSTMPPRQFLSEEAMAITLAEAGLTPHGTLMVRHQLTAPPTVRAVGPGGVEASEGEVLVDEQENEPDEEEGEEESEGGADGERAAAPSGEDEDDEEGESEGESEGEEHDDDAPPFGGRIHGMMPSAFGGGGRGGRGSAALERLGRQFGAPPGPPAPFASAGTGNVLGSAGPDAAAMTPQQRREAALAALAARSSAAEAPQAVPSAEAAGAAGAAEAPAEPPAASAGVPVEDQALAARREAAAKREAALAAAMARSTTITVPAAPPPQLAAAPPPPAAVPSSGPREQSAQASAAAAAALARFGPAAGASAVASGSATAATSESGRQALGAKGKETMAERMARAHGSKTVLAGPSPSKAAEPGKVAYKPSAAVVAAAAATPAATTGVDRAEQLAKVAAMKEAKVAKERERLAIKARLDEDRKAYQALKAGSAGHTSMAAPPPSVGSSAAEGSSGEAAASESTASEGVTESELRVRCTDGTVLRLTLDASEPLSTVASIVAEGRTDDGGATHPTLARRGSGGEMG